MVTTIKNQGWNYYCANCRMKFQKIVPNCPFCGAICSNYEEVIVDLSKRLNDEEARKLIEEMLE